MFTTTTMNKMIKQENLLLINICFKLQHFRIGEDSGVVCMGSGNRVTLTLMPPWLTYIHNNII